MSCKGWLPVCRLALLWIPDLGYLEEKHFPNSRLGLAMGCCVMYVYS